MHSTLTIALVTVLGVAVLACRGGDSDGPGAVSDAVSDANPFFTESELPFSLPPFDRIEDRHYRPAFERGMADHLGEIEAIAKWLALVRGPDSQDAPVRMWTRRPSGGWAIDGT